LPCGVPGSVLGVEAGDCGQSPDRANSRLHARVYFENHLKKHARSEVAQVIVNTNVTQLLRAIRVNAELQTGSGFCFSLSRSNAPTLHTLHNPSNCPHFCFLLSQFLLSAFLTARSTRSTFLSWGFKFQVSALNPVFRSVVSPRSTPLALAFLSTLFYPIPPFSTLIYEKPSLPQPSATTHISAFCFHNFCFWPG
jgi:hypothetical protein